jgi:GTP-binding protein HflX
MQVETIVGEQKAILVGVTLPGQPSEAKSDHISELAQLAETAGLTVSDHLFQEREKIHAAYFIGPGKVNELREVVNQSQPAIVIFDDDLSPAQIRNLEKVLDVRVIDRSTLILDIFAKHARTREAKTQVELAQLQYLLPRLTRQWTHLSRQVGGIGTRGPGETQLETDRRLIRRRIEKLKHDLHKIDSQQTIRRQNRKNTFRASLIGYTNVGKSTLMNLLSGADLLVENQLFATLDSVVRKVSLEGAQEILLSDTVGFIRKLPHHLVASFKSTLDEVHEADLLLHVVDVHHPYFREQMQVVMRILEDLDSHTKPILIIFNKIDLLPDTNILPSLRKEYPESVFLSATRHIGVESLKQKLKEFLEKNFVSLFLRIPQQEQKLIHYIYSLARVEKIQYDGEGVEISMKCDRETLSRIKQLPGILLRIDDKVKPFKELVL